MNALERVVEYLAKREEPRASDLIVGMGSDCPRVPEHAAALYHRGMAPLVLFSGGRGRLTGELPGSEAEFMRKRAAQAGVPIARILVEDRSTNTFENILFSAAVLKALGIRIRRALIVSQPVLQRRAWSTAVRQWPAVEWISNPAPMDARQLAAGGDLRMASLAVGEIERLGRYGKIGYLEEQTIPDEVRRACEELSARAAGAAARQPGRAPRPLY